MQSGQDRPFRPRSPLAAFPAAEDSPSPDRPGQCHDGVRGAYRWLLRPRSVPQAYRRNPRSEEHTSELQSLMRISYAVFCLKKTTQTQTHIRISIAVCSVETTTYR